MTVSRKIVIIDTITWEPFYWEDFRHIPREALDNMPPNKLYETPDKLYNDLKNATGVLAFPLDMDEEFLDWFEGLVEEYRP